MKNYAMIATWKMAAAGVAAAHPFLQDTSPISTSISIAVRTVEDNPAFGSVGYGGLPNREGDVELDAAYMDGNTFAFGGVIGTQHTKNPIDVAISLSERRLNCLLAGQGAEQYISRHGFARQNMLTPESQARWQTEKQEREKEQADSNTLTAYDGHDTVCVIAKKGEHQAAGVSTSGLFYKEPGRVGDSPLVGHGLYSDSKIGSACATGVGEEIIRGCLSYDIVRRMEDGTTPLEACRQSLLRHHQRLTGAGITPSKMSVIAMDQYGQTGAATNLDQFAFVVCDGKNQAVTLWIAEDIKNGGAIYPATAEQLRNYKND